MASEAEVDAVVEGGVSLSAHTLPVIHLYSPAPAQEEQHEGTSLAAPTLNLSPSHYQSSQTLPIRGKHGVPP
jgi:hypothetical protein